MNVYSPESLDLSFLDEDICANSKCVYIGTYFFELGCAHTLCIEHVLLYNHCPVCAKEIILAELKVPENMPGHQLIQKLFLNATKDRFLIARLNEENAALQDKMVEYQETLELSFNRQYYLIEECQRLSPKKSSVTRLHHSGRESPAIIADV